MLQLQQTKQLARGRYVSPYSSNSWRTADNELLILAEMRTSHLFFVFRMLFDKVAPELGTEPLRKGRGRQANPGWTAEWVAERMVWMITDILKRGDLENKYRGQFLEMLQYLLGDYDLRLLVLPECRKLLTSG